MYSEVIFKLHMKLLFASVMVRIDHSDGISGHISKTAVAVEAFGCLMIAVTIVGYDEHEN